MPNSLPPPSSSSSDNYWGTFDIESDQNFPVTSQSIIPSNLSSIHIMPHQSSANIPYPPSQELPIEQYLLQQQSHIPPYYQDDNDIHDFVGDDLGIEVGVGVEHSSNPQHSMSSSNLTKLVTNQGVNNSSNIPRPQSVPLPTNPHAGREKQSAHSKPIEGILLFLLKYFFSSFFLKILN